MLGMGMAIDLILGFFQKPIDLPEFLATKGFEFRSEETLRAQRFTMIPSRWYRYFADGASTRGVWLYYHEGVESDEKEMWESFSPQRAIVATATISTYMSRNGFDEMVQRETTLSVRNKYEGLIFDPQEPTLG